MSLTPAAVTIIFDQTRTKILLVKRRDIPIWVLPGGGIDRDETPEQAGVREAYEETGYHVEIERQSGEYYPINRLAALTYVYVCHILRGEATLSTETSEIEFFPLNQLPKNFFIIHFDWLEDARLSQVTVKKKMAQVTYWATVKYLFKHPLQLTQYLISRFWTSKS